MKIFLFSASVFFFLGLKLISQIDIIPNFFHKATSSETTTVPSTKIDLQQTETKSVLTKKDTVSSAETKSNQLSAPEVKNTEK